MYLYKHDSRQPDLDIDFIQSTQIQYSINSNGED